MKKTGMKISVTIWAVVCAALLTYAQTATGRLVGTVQGPDGVVAGAKLVITDNLTRKERVITANGEGSFIVSNLDVGTYTIKVSAAGFNTYVATDLKIDVGKEYTLNPKFTVGNVTTEVTVWACADVVNSSKDELSNSYTRQQI